MSAPRATLRLQFHKDFTFADAARLVPYFSALGISHVYASPILTARPGSLHGYDVIDPTRINPEIGGEGGLRELVAALRRADLGLVVDIVPNHMAAGAGNAWWWDVLQNGRTSAHAHYFDIDWEPDDRELHGKILVPVLGRSCAEALGAGEIKLTHDASRGCVIKYFEHAFPVARADWNEIERAGLAAYDPADADGRDRLAALLARQHYRLAYWRVANDEINWRRFFDINELIGVKVEHDDVFEATHAAILRLYAEGLIDGVRVDHIDGLAHPGDYGRKLRERLADLGSQRPEHAPTGPAYIVVEKILGPGERLRADWACDGTSGYDFMDQVSAVLHDGAAQQRLAALWAKVSGRSPSFAVEAEASRREILDRSFTAQLNATARAFHRLARACGVDVSRPAIRRALVEILAHFPVYRLYTRPARRSEEDLLFLDRVRQAAVATCLPGDRPVVELVATWLGGETSPGADQTLHARALTAFHQLSAPVAAKAVEDTAFYRYGAALSRIDVGFDPSRFAATPDDFHAQARARREYFPSSMLATATHDHKRGEDVRARLAVLSEIPGEWAAALERWLARSASLCEAVGGAPAPHPRDIALLLQTIVGAWPPSLTLDDAPGLQEFAERLAGWQQKALREAKLATDWIAPNEAYESAARNFLMRLLAGEADLLPDIARFAQRIAPAGAANGLAQTLLKLTAPGVPDIYQGTDYWDLSLVDPDNRRPVDFAARMASLDESGFDALAATWRDGRIKQAVIARTLAVRRAAPRLFAEGSYVPIDVRGPLARHVLAFARILDDTITVTVVCRLTVALLADDSLAIQRLRWSGTRLVLPPQCRDAQWRDVFAGADCRHDPADLAAILPHLTIALLGTQRHK
ncbi:MAG: malto-oligosyltrehalose synthase [Bradyrhizobiaceae bacterium]|nr:malto-oligosyltrehalose synthase [Hyphomicrobiales bacterium]MBV9426896.1 malto-oligosyltrehalose synthase [Bradyrhizobiaceae bacterium]